MHAVSYEQDFLRRSDEGMVFAAEEEKTGVYKIKNTQTGDFYIGSATITFKRRWTQHRSDLKRQKHRNIHLQRAYNKYTASLFKFEIVEFCEPEIAVEREQFYLDTLKPRYNINPEASGSRGRKMSPENIAKLRQRLLGRPAWNKGLPFSAAVRKRMAESAVKRAQRPGESERRSKIFRDAHVPKPVIRNDGLRYASIRECAEDLNVKENTIIKACTDTKQLRRVRGFVLKYV
jgi:group I intron endonuclease